MHRSTRTPTARGFTLIELLVVIAIIVALLAILFPSMNRAIRASLDAKCAANLRQCTLAIFDYAADHRGHLAFRANNMQSPTLYDTNGGPANPGGNWLEDRFVGDYLPNLEIWNCTFSEVPLIEDPRNTRAWCYGSFAYWPANGTATGAFGPYAAYPMRVSQMGGSTPMIQDDVSDNRPWKYAPGWQANHTTDNYWIWKAMNDVNPSNVNRRTDDAIDVRGANVGTFDGSVTFYRLTEMKVAYIDNLGRPYYSAFAGN